FVYFLFVAWLVVALVLLPHALIWALPDEVAPIPAWASWMPSAWWIAAMVPLLMAAIWAYVYDTDVLVNRSRHLWGLGGAAVLMLLILLWTLLPRFGNLAPAFKPDPLLVGIALVAILWVLAWTAVLNRFWPGLAANDPNRLARGRLQMTGALRKTLIAA